MDPNEWMKGGTKVPSQKWNAIGDKVVGEIVEVLVQQCRDFTTNELEWWDKEQKEPKEQLIVTLATEQRDPAIENDDGHRRIYARKPSSMLEAIAKVSLAKGLQLQAGGRLGVVFVAEKPHENPRFNAIKQFDAAYEAPAPGVADVANLLGNSTAQAPAPEAAAPAPTTDPQPAVASAAGLL